MTDTDIKTIEIEIKKPFIKKDYDKNFSNEWRKNNRELHLQKQKEQYEKHKEKRLEYQREYDRKKRIKKQEQRKKDLEQAKLNSI